jgi:soluble lytic murein transglycosylase-like protein
VLGAGVLLGLLAGCASGPPVVPGRPDCPGPPPSALSCRIAASEATLRDPAATPTAIESAGRAADQAYRLLGEHPEWDAAVAAGLDPARRAQTRLTTAAYRELRSLAGPPRDTLPAWRIVEPPPVDVLRGYYAEAQRRFGVDWTVLAAINLVETRMGRVVGLSSAGAQGPMQFMPATWAAYGLGGDVWQPRDAVLGAAHYLARNGGADPNRLDRALLRYNNDDRYVRAVRGYADLLAADPAALVGLHAWPVHYRTVAGDVPLPTGYASQRPVPVAEWLAAHPLPPPG